MSPFIQFLYLFTWLAYNIKINRFIDGTLLRWRAIASSHRQGKKKQVWYGNVRKRGASAGYRFIFF